MKDVILELVKLAQALDDMGNSGAANAVDKMTKDLYKSESDDE